MAITHKARLGLHLHPPISPKTDHPIRMVVTTLGCFVVIVFMLLELVGCLLLPVDVLLQLFK